MKFFISFVISCYIGLVAIAQSFTFNDLPWLSAQSASATIGTSPDKIFNVRYWWHYTDAGPTNVNVTNWLDRIQNLPLTNSLNSSRPTNSTLGVGFNGSTFLSNTAPFQILIGNGRTGSVWIVSSLITSAGGLGAIIGDNTSGGGGFFETSGNQMKWFGAGGSGTVCDFASGSSIRDVAILITNTTSGQMLFYTNNIFINTPGIGAGDTTNPQLWVGASTTGATVPVNFPKMQILDLAYFYGKLTSSDLTQLHMWATNTYKGFATFSP